MGGEWTLGLIKTVGWEWIDGETYETWMTGWGITPVGSSSLELPDYSKYSNMVNWEQASGWLILADSNGVLYTHNNGTLENAFTPDQNGAHISDASHAQTDPTNLTYAVDKQDFDYLVNKFNDVLALLENAKVMASS